MPTKELSGLADARLPSSSLSFADIFRNRKENSNGTWCTYVGQGVAGAEPASARDRMQSGGLVIVANRPRFHIEKNSRIYTIGSCFARNVERSLEEYGFDVPTARVDIPPEMYSAPTIFNNTVLNKYNAHSIAEEIFRGLDPERDPGLIEVGEDQWYDPQTFNMKSVNYIETLALRGRLDRIAQEVARCDTVLVTLGLTETCFDQTTGRVFNALAAMAFRDRGKRERVGFFNATPDQIVTILSAAFEALRTVNPKVQIVMTVSPVPMLNTFTEMDVISANAYSKSALRVACEIMYRKYDFVDYFPSYEIVMHSPRNITWYDDEVHVKMDLVDKVIGVFSERYIAA